MEKKALYCATLYVRNIKKHRKGYQEIKIGYLQCVSRIWVEKKEGIVDGGSREWPFCEYAFYTHLIFRTMLIFTYTPPPIKGKKIHKDKEKVELKQKQIEISELNCM